MSLTYCVAVISCDLSELELLNVTNPFKKVMYISGLGRSNICKFMEEGRFPNSVSLGDKAVVWVEPRVLREVND